VSEIDVEQQALRSRSGPVHAEVALAGAALAGVALLVFAPHVRHGGFYSDDWSNASFYRDLGYGDMAVHFWRELIPWRPVLAFLLPLPHALFGLDPTYHLALAGVLATLASFSFFVLLRALRLELPHALALAVLSLVFPWSDALRLWATGSLNNVALIAYFLGSAAAVRALGLQRADRYRRVALHGLAAVLYLVSVLTYEVAAPAILLSGLLYRMRFPWRTLRTRWLVDAALVLVPLALLIVPTSKARAVGSPTERATDVPEFVAQGSSVFASTFLPPGASSSLLKLLALAAVGGVVGAAIWRARRDREREVRKWLLGAAAGTSAVALGHLMFLGYGLYPLSQGLDDRVNAFAAFGFVVATYSVLALLSLLVAGRPGHWAAAVLAAGTLLVGLGFVQRVRDDIARYNSATAQQRDELAALRRLLPRARPGSTIFAFGYPTASAPGVPIFGNPWDLTFAVSLFWNDPLLTVVPVGNEVVSCGRTEARPGRYGTEYAAAYGRAEFVDLSMGSVRYVASRHECLAARAMFAPD